MEKVYKPRNKAFIGAIIGAAASIAGGIINSAKQKKAARAEAERQKGIKRDNMIMKSTEALNAGLQNQDELQSNFMNQYMKYGGSTKTTKYRDRQKKNIGGLGEIVGSLIGGASTVIGAATGNQTIATAGNTIGQAVGQGLTDYNAKRIAEQRKDLSAKQTTDANGNTIVVNGDQPIKKYGGRKSILIPDKSGIKINTKRS